MAKAPGTVFGFYRTGIGALLLTPWIFIRKEDHVYHTNLTLLIFPLLGGVATALDLCFWNTGLAYTTVANATLMSNTAPIWVVLAAWIFFKQKFKPSFWVGLSLTAVGAVIVLGYNFLYHPQFSKGDFMGMASGFFYAGYYLATQEGRKHLNTASYLWVVMITAMFTTGAISLALGYKLFGYPLQTLVCFVIAGVVTQLIGYLSIAYALGRLPASVVSPTLILQPIISALIAIPLFGEYLQPLQWIGTIVVLAGIYLINLTQETKEIVRPVSELEPVARD
jgi:drug/metabolite transporter (DMT)-like permease